MSYANCWSDVLRARFSELQLFIDLRTGSYQDLSSYARVVTLTDPVGPAQWQNRTRGRSVSWSGAFGMCGWFSTPNAAELNLAPSGTIVELLRTDTPIGAGARYAYKRNGVVTVAYDMFENTGAGGLALYDGNTVHALGTLTLPTVRSVAASFTAGSAPFGYQNGVLLVPPATLWAPLGVDNSVLYLPAGGVTPPGVGWHAFLLFNARLTGAEISQLYNDFLASGFAL